MTQPIAKKPAIKTWKPQEKRTPNTQAQDKSQISPNMENPTLSNSETSQNLILANPIQPVPTLIIHDPKDVSATLSTPGKTLSVNTINEAEPAFGPWQDLFNGQDLTGWVKIGKGTFDLDTKESKLVPNIDWPDWGLGLLLCTTEIGDGELEIQFSVSKESDNSGVFIRIPKIPENAWDAVHTGYEVQINDNAPNPIHQTGSIYDFKEPDVPITLNYKEKIHTMVIRMHGKHYQVWIDKQLITDYVEPEFSQEASENASKEHQQNPDQHAPKPARGPRPDDKGFMGLQIHDPYSFVCIFKVRFRERLKAHEIDHSTSPKEE